MKFDKLKMEKIGEGDEKVVYIDPKNPKNVLAFHHEGFYPPPTRNQMKGMFYLTEIARIFFPNNIPEIRFAATDPSVMSRKKVQFGKEHQALQRGLYLDRGAVTGREMGVAREVLSANKEIKEFRSALAGCGLPDGDGIHNFGHDQTGNAQYAEPFQAFTLFGDELILQFDPDKLEKAIDRLDGEDKKRALAHYNRLTHIIEDERKRLNDRLK